MTIVNLDDYRPQEVINYDELIALLESFAPKN